MSLDPNFPSGAPAADRHQPTILVVGTDAAMRQELQSLLQGHYHIVTAGNGMEALAQLKAYSPSLLISEVGMPGMSGIELLKALKENPEPSGIPVLLISSGEEVSSEGYEIRADDYLTKPFSSEDLLARVHSRMNIVQTGKHVLQDVYKMFDEMPLAIAALKGPDLVIAYINQYNLDVWERKREDVLGKRLFEVRPDLKESVQGLHAEVYASGKRLTSNDIPVEIIINGKPEIHYFNATIDPILDEQGIIIGQLATSIDVTKEVLARKKAEQSEQNLLELANAMPQLVWIADLSGEVIYYNNRVSEFAGAKMRADGSWSWEGMLHPDDVDPTARAWTHAVGTGTTYELEHRVQRVDGAYRWYLSRSIPQKDADGRIVKWFGTATDIHGQKEAAEKIKESEARFRMLADESPMFVFIIEANAEATISYWNKTWLDYTGQTVEEALGRAWDGIIHPEDVPLALDIYGLAFAKRQSYYIPAVRTKRHDDVYRWHSFKGSPRHDATGEFKGYVGVGFDIHEQKLAEQEVKRFKHMADHAADPFILMREDGTFDYLNKVALEQWNYTLEEAKNLRVPDVDPLFDDEVFNEVFAAAQQGEIPPFETLHQKKNGTIYPVEVHMGGLTLDGQPHMFAMARDITERKQSEEVLGYRKALLEAQNEAIPDALLIVDTKGSILSYNQHFVDLWNIPQEIIDRKDDAAALQFAMTQLKDPQQFMERVNYCYAHPNESVNEEVLFIDGRVIERYGNAVVGESGISYGWAWYFRDITESKQLEKQKDDFISMASHELKTPVTSLKGYTQLLRNKSIKEGDSFAINLFTRIDKQIDKLTYLISDLLDATKVSNGHLTYLDDHFDFNVLVIEIVEEMRHTTQSHRLNVDLANSANVLGDRNRIGQVITNILSNAIKYSPAADEVMISTRLENEHIQFSARDFGVGIPKDMQTNVFGRFFRIDGTHKNNFAGGLGLGLYISAEIIKQHKGHMTVESDEGRGSTFSFALPLGENWNRPKNR